MKFLIFSLCLFANLQLSAQSLTSHLPPERKAFFHQLKSSFLEVIEEGNVYFNEDLGNYPFLAKIIQHDYLKWDPKGKPRNYETLCSPDDWKKKSLSPDITVEEYPAALDQFLKQCEPIWRTRWKDVVSNSLGIVSLKMHPNRYPYGRHVVLHLPQQVKVKALLAMKSDGKKRPLVMLRTGLFSNTQEFYPERFLFLQLFEQSPFNVMLIESSSGSEFIKHNHSAYALGGFDEGLQNFWIAQKLQDPNEPISQFVNSVHMTGLSLGGHGTLFTALLNDLNPKPDGSSVLQSAMAFCPLLNMQETLDYHRSQGFSMDLMNYWASRRLQVVRNQIPELKDENFIPDFFQWIQKNYKAPLISESGEVPGIRLPDRAQDLLRQKPVPEDLFWQLNHYWPWFRNVKTPVVIFSTREDPIVSWFINSGRLEDGRLKLENSNVRLFTFEEGYHCSLPIAYDWSALATLFQTFVLKMSPGFEQEAREVRIPLSASVLEKVSETEKPIIDLSYTVEKGTAGILAKASFHSRSSGIFKWAFWEKWLWLAPSMTIQLPLSEMEFPIEKVVHSKDEESLLRRWAHQNIRARIEESNLVLSWSITKK